MHVQYLPVRVDPRRCSARRRCRTPTLRCVCVDSDHPLTTEQTTWLLSRDYRQSLQQPAVQTKPCRRPLQPANAERSTSVSTGAQASGVYPAWTHPSSEGYCHDVASEFCSAPLLTKVGKTEDAVVSVGRSMRSDEERLHSLSVRQNSIESRALFEIRSLYCTFSFANYASRPKRQSPIET